MQYLVTGGSGFIGSHLVERLLKDGHSVINIDNFDDFYDYKIKISNTLQSVAEAPQRHFSDKDKDIAMLKKRVASERYKLYNQDIRDPESLRKIFAAHTFDAVIHLAALAGVRPSIERPLEYESVNIRGTLNLWECCKDFGIKKFVCASSSSVYGNNKTVPFSEKDRVDGPISPYAATKKCTEILGHVYHKLYEIDMFQLRFFTVYGPRQRPDLAIYKFAELISAGREIPFYGDGSTARDYTFINDIIDGIIKSIHYLQSNAGIYEVLNLGENAVITLNEMVEMLEQALGKKSFKKYLPPQPGDMPKTYADISKARTLIGYSPRTDFQSGINNFVEWFLGNQRIITSDGRY